MNNTIHCSRCGAPLPVDWPKGLCQHCALEEALAAPGGESQLLTLDDEDSSGSEGQAKAGKELWAPKSFGDYELLEELGRGGMGVVYKARQVSLNRLVAVKLILSGEFASKQEVLRFRGESEAAANLRHPNIVAIYETGELEGQNYFSMDYVGGPTLAEMVRGKPLPPHRAARYLRIIAEAIHYAHEQGILHRDLKPSNILIDSDDQPRITDFGLARRLRGDFGVTVTGQALGSPSFMPPEQTSGKHSRVGQPGDVYGLGAILYHLLTGRPPFQAETMEEVLRQLHERDPVAPRLLNASIPRDLETICLKCLEKEPEKRYPTALALAEELGRFQRDESICARPAKPLEKAWRWCRRKPALATLVLLVAVVGAAGLTGVLWQWHRAERSARAAELSAQAERVERDHFQALAYTSDMLLAQKALEAGNLATVRRKLDFHRPTRKSEIQNPQPEIDRRDWEWRYLWQRSRGDEEATLRQGPAQALCVAYSPDRKVLASSDNHGIIRLWNLATKQQTASVASDSSGDLLQFADDGVRLVSAGFRNGLRFWDWNSPVLRRREPPLSKGCIAGFWLGASELMAVDPSRKLRLRWELPSGRELPSAPVLAEMSNVLESWSVFSPDGRWLATSTNRTILLWEARSGTLSKTLTNHTAVAHPLTFSRDGRILATGDFDGVLKLWNTETWLELASAPAHQIITEHADFSPDSKSLVTCSYDYTLKLWDVSPLRELGALRGHLGEIYDVRFSPNGSQIASASADGTVKLWRPVPKRSESGSARLPLDVRLWSLAPDGQWLLLLFTDDTCSLWNLKNEPSWLASPRRPLGTSNVTAAAIFPGGRTLALGHRDGRVVVHDTVTLEPTTELSGFDVTVARFGCSLDGHTLAAQNTDHLIKVWALPSGAELGRFTQTNNDYYTRVPISPDGRAVMTTSFDGTVDFWTLPDLHQRTLRASEEQFVTGVDFFRDGRRVVTCGVDKTARVWDFAAPAQPTSIMYSDLNGLRSVALSPDERRLAVGDDVGRPRKVKVFDVTSGEQVAVMGTHQDSIVDLAFWPDGDAIVSVSRDSVQVWRAPSWAEIEAREKREANRQ